MSGIPDSNRNGRPNKETTRRQEKYRLKDNKTINMFLFCFLILLICPQTITEHNSKHENTTENRTSSESLGLKRKEVNSLSVVKLTKEEQSSHEKEKALSNGEKGIKRDVLRNGTHVRGIKQDGMTSSPEDNVLDSVRGQQDPYVRSTNLLPPRIYQNKITFNTATHTESAREHEADSEINTETLHNLSVLVKERANLRIVSPTDTVKNCKRDNEKPSDIRMKHFRLESKSAALKQNVSEEYHRVILSSRPSEANISVVRNRRDYFQPVNDENVLWTSNGVSFYNQSLVSFLSSVDNKKMEAQTSFQNNYSDGGSQHYHRNGKIEHSEFPVNVRTWNRDRNSNARIFRDNRENSAKLPVTEVSKPDRTGRETPTDLFMNSQDSDPKKGKKESRNTHSYRSEHTETPSISNLDHSVETDYETPPSSFSPSYEVYGRTTSTGNLVSFDSIYDTDFGFEEYGVAPESATTDFVTEDGETLTETAQRGPCAQWQHRCSDGTCIDTSQYCDGIANCRDYSDELPGCTACNRKHEGRLGRSYVVSVPSLPSERAPPALLNNTTPNCSITFSASGGVMGDVVQLSFERFKVGEYIPANRQGHGTPSQCLGSHISITENERRSPGGSWCGEGEGTNIYYSEGRTVTVTIVTLPNSLHSNVQIRYRFLTKSSAVVRYGNTTSPKYRGEPVSNSDCSRILQGCRAKSCVLQSPNFPGFYPRNVTCYYLVKALPAPSLEFEPLIVIGQPNNRLIHVGDQDLVSRVSPEVSLNKECPGDHISIYDGGEMKAPLLTRFCGSTSLPNITSSGPEMLVVFQSAAAGRMNHPPNMVIGFELLAKVRFRKQSTETGCYYKISSTSSKTGTIANPSFTMPSNTSCVYNFYGEVQEVLWLYFSKYYRRAKYDGDVELSECRNGLLIENVVSIDEENNSTLLGEFCGHVTPPVCIRSRQKHKLTKPCTSKESFISKSPNVIVTQKFSEGTSLMPLQYLLHYEFVTVDRSNEMLYYNYDKCNEFYTSSMAKSGTLSSPKSVFYFGRGGNTYLNCSYTFQLKSNETLHIKITALMLQNSFCKSTYNYHYDSYQCNISPRNLATLKIMEHTQNDITVESGCLCDNRSIPLDFTSHAKKITIIFSIRNMTWGQDSSDYSFEAEYKYKEADYCEKDRVMQGNSGSIILGNSTESKYCSSLPWILNSQMHHYLYMRIPGSHPSSPSCSTQNRIIIFYENQQSKPICPSVNGEEESVSIFSSGWHERGPWHKPQWLLFRYIGREKGAYVIQWLEITRDPQPPALESIAASGGGRRIWGSNSHDTSSCNAACPEISACINSTLWCDGVAHCPSGADENNCNPSKFTWLRTVVMLGSGTALGAVGVTVLGITMTHVWRQRQIKRRKKKQTQQIMTHDVLLPLATKADSFYSS